ncbi:MAG: inositol monophosphatase family protein [Spirochaetota bacterium]
MKYETEHRCALSAAYTASRLCRDVRHNTFSRLVKSDDTPVTIADFGSQALICDTLARCFPQDQIVAEEESETLRDESMHGFTQSVTAYIHRYQPGFTIDDVIDRVSLGNGTPSQRFWTVDPLDGTKGFIRGAHYSVAVALIEEGTVMTAALGCPTWDPLTVVSAVRGEGVFITTEEDTVRVQSADLSPFPPRKFVQSVEHATGCSTLHRTIAGKLSITDEPVLLDSQLKYLTLARREAMVYLRIPGVTNSRYREKIWDHAAGSLILEEYGGTVTNRYGDTLDFSGRTLKPGAGICASIGIDHIDVIRAITGS